MLNKQHNGQTKGTQIEEERKGKKELKEKIKLAIMQWGLVRAYAEMQSGKKRRRAVSCGDMGRMIF